MDGVTIVSHPLVQHKLTLLRKKDISTKSFRELLKEIGMLLCYEITRDLPLALHLVEEAIRTNARTDLRRAPESSSPRTHLSSEGTQSKVGQAAGEN